MGGLKMNKINVAIADDNQRTVEMMTELLEQESDIEVIASADDGEEALRIINQMPKWKPGELEDGTKVAVYFTVPVMFRLQ